MEKLKYEFDPHNRLTVTNTALRGVRRVLDGQFKISGHNTLTYHVKSPIPSDIKAPHQIKLKGTWSLTKDHQLRLTLDKLGRETLGDTLTLQGEILDVKNNSFLFAVSTRTKDNLPFIYILEVVGFWQADEHNGLTFRAYKERSKFDSLTFDGTWQIDENYQVTYSYQKERLLRKSKKIHTLIFKGYWDIMDKARISYILERDSLSGFNFNARVGTFKEDYIKYELGIGVSRKKKPVKRTITFFGKWKVRKNTGLAFEVRKGGKRIQDIVFGAKVKLTDKSMAGFNLKNSLNKEIGAELELSRDIFKGEGQVFLRLLKTRGESAILAGAGWGW